MNLTVIIPAYNAEKYIGEAIESVLNQLEERPELIVVDDGSDDDTAKIASEYGAIVKSQTHSGAAKARNLGVKDAHGEYVYFLDADDISVEGAINKLHEELSEDIFGVFGYTQDFISPELSDEEKSALFPRQLPYSGILPGASLFKREVFEKVGLFDENLSSGEVIDWMVRYRNKNLKTVNLCDIVLHRRLHTNNTGRVDKKAEFANYAAILRKLRNS